MRFVHSSDWQIGKTFAFAGDEALHALQAERIQVIRRLGHLARKEGAATILVAGDVYDHESPSDKTLRQPLERMRDFPDIQWRLIPGNHDAHLPNGVWSRLLKAGLPDNVTAHLEPVPTPMNAEETAWLLPGVLTRRHTMTDTTAWMDGAATPEGAMRIGLAHGSVRGFSSDPSQQTNPVAPDRPDKAGLSYLALGDWHGFNRIGPRCAYSGSPECDRFDTGGAGGGESLIVTVDAPGAPPEIERHVTGRFLWREVSATLSSLEDVRALEDRLRAIDPDEPSRVLARLKADGVLPLSAMAVFEESILGAVASALLLLRVDQTPETTATEGDLSVFEGAGAISEAAARLTALAASGGPDQKHALPALRRLAALWRQESGA
ncbi:DNA repair exonuclease [Acetobacter sacchari]|uniref:DNA repair exonuclease n=1 Tax=Acetobacter sacchari TaxID=2661687 RepID=A0ABS3LS56_9PROT|nr:DNA repair exonuclease [Acetobacter sacchari]